MFCNTHSVLEARPGPKQMVSFPFLFPFKGLYGDYDVLTLIPRYPDVSHVKGVVSEGEKREKITKI